MALRSRSRTATATSGPGRGPASDGRVRHRRPRSVARGRTARHRHPSAEELRRRAEALFGEHAEPLRRADMGAPAGEWEGERAGERRESGQGPPGEGLRGQGVPGEGSSGQGLPGQGAFGEGDWRERAGLALRERMPLWLQTRCGLERRSVVALTVVLVVAAAFAVQHFWAGRTQSVRPPEVVRAAAQYGEEPGQGGRAEAGPGAAAAGSVKAGGAAGAAGAVGTAGAGAAGASGGAEIVVDVSGKVRDPGIHRLPAGSRVADALKAAGGVKPGTDTDGLNRARFLVDGEQVIVGGAAPFAGAGAAAGAGAGAGSAGSTGSAGGATGVSGGTMAGAPVSLNTATLDQLDTLPGVGPVLAQHIVDYRTQHGGFRSVDELREVNGIGDRRFADLRNLVRP
ncbi:helix-hairpin-helix domain-containing protein [Streptomyces levis]|uniref:helix-hairpin-helix domain-containing protein n=1 Tax=Streptomyces levis TaxID=285566 RepID=UPI003C7CC87F